MHWKATSFLEKRVQNDSKSSMPRPVSVKVCFILFMPIKTPTNWIFRSSDTPMPSDRFFIFLSLFLSLISTSTQLTGQLALGTVALIAHLEVHGMWKVLKRRSWTEEHLSPFLVFIRFMELITNPQYHRYNGNLHSCVTYPFSPITLIFKSPRLVLFWWLWEHRCFKLLFGFVRHWHYWWWWFSD